MPPEGSVGKVIIWLLPFSLGRKSIYHQYHCQSSNYKKWDYYLLKYQLIEMLLLYINFYQPKAIPAAVPKLL